MRASRALMILTLLALPASASEPILHEFVAANPAEDLAFSATTGNGKLPAAIRTPGGPIPAPDVQQSPYASQNAYGGGSTPSSPDATYRIDRDTTRPEVVDYDDPFVPGITPFKRLYAFDSVDPGLELLVADKRLAPIATTGREPQPGEDSFFADLVVDLVENTAVRIPSVGPGTRIVSAVINPKTSFEILRDSADNWFVRTGERKRARLIMQLAIARSTFGSDFADVSAAALASDVPPLPESVRAATRRMLQHIGVTPQMRPRAALAALVSYFRSFEASAELPAATRGPALYEELTRSQKGVCRHRAYAFMLTALAAGIPARFVHNEAHAWVEVFDDSIWHRIDLGGAASRINMDEDSQNPQHAPPADPYTWPKGTNQNGSDLANQVRSGQAQNANAGAAIEPAPQPTGGAGSPGSPAPDPGLQPSDAPIDDRAKSRIELQVKDREVRRGEPLSMSGTVSAGGEPCAYVRVDLALRTAQGLLIPMQPLPTGPDGRFEGRVIVPLQGLDLGEYDVIASTPGNAACGPGEGD